MMDRRTLIAMIGVTVVAAPAFGQGRHMMMDDDMPIYGSQMMTERERLEYRERMHNAQTEQERERIRAEHHERMRERAKQRGINLPDAPPQNQGGGMGQQKHMPGMGGGGRRGG